MRLWHKDLIDVLPSKMLVAQWRELSAIVGKINKVGTPNHRLVNPVLNYDKRELYIYTCLIYKEMIKREMKPSEIVLNKIKNYTGICKDLSRTIFSDWHNQRYLKQCYYNLEEKYDRGIILEKEWGKIETKYKKLTEK